MKLLQRTGRYYVLYSTLIFLFWGLGLFLALRFVMNHETNERLRDLKKVLHYQVHQMDSIPSAIEVLDNIVEINALPAFTQYERFTDTLQWVPSEKEHPILFRKYTYHDTFQGTPCRVSINQSIMDTEEMLTTIAIAVVTILGLMLFTINLFNRYLSLQLWKPFYRTIEQIKTFTFDRKEPLSAPPTNIDEFNTLQKAINQMTTKVLSDYRSLKQFTENASHEIQNPLAIIKSKIELLIQREDLSEKELETIQHIQRATSRLSKLNHSLLLLTRIENRQFNNNLPLDLQTVIDHQLDLAKPLITAKNLTIDTDLQSVSQQMDPTLGEVLISNLLGNAIKHNLPGGAIHIQLNQQQLQFTNTGEPLSVPSDKLFERFHKAKEAAPSLGLGLAIVKEICTSYGFDVQYHYQKGQHSLVVIF